MVISRSPYRHDIDGLRALAVTFVILDHLGIPGFTGGYVGVDVFFVISGYVITRNIAKDIATAQFSIWDFYERRVRRLLPGFAVVAFLALVAASQILLPREFVLMTTSLLAASCGASNIYFWSQAGYFDQLSITKPMLHTWSLGVEEQFYLIYPALLIYLHKLGKSWLLPILIALGGLSFCYATLRVHQHPVGTFFLMPSRLWELLLGGLVYLSFYRRSVPGHLAFALSCGGLISIIVATVVYSQTTVFPGASALLPTLGAAAVIVGGQHPTPIFRMLSLPPLAYVGKISYLLYLVHWPIIVLWSSYKITSLNLSDKFLILIFSFIISTGVYVFVEHPFRSKLIFRPRWQSYGLGLAFLIFCSVLCYINQLTHGFPDRFGSRLTAVQDAGPWLSQDDNLMKGVIPFSGGKRIDHGHVAPRDVRTFGGLGPADIAFFGDSHCSSLFDGAVSEAIARKHRIEFYVDYFSPPVLRLNSWNMDGAAYNHEVISLLCQDTNIQTVVLAANWTLYLRGASYIENQYPLLQMEGKAIAPDQLNAVFCTQLTETLKLLVASGKRVYVLAPLPDYSRNVEDTLERCAMSGRDVYRYLDTSRTAYLARHAETISLLTQATKDSGAVLIPTSQSLWDGSHFVVEDHGISLYLDYHHLSPLGSMHVAPFVFDRIYSVSTPKN